MNDPAQTPPPPAGAPSAVPEPESRARRSDGLLRSWMRDLLLSLGISAFFIVFLYQPVKVEGTSMLPELQDQERIFINKFIYHVESVHRGDIVVFRYPCDPSKSFIKRVIAVPGDRLRIDEGRVYLNGRPLDEAYVPEEYEDGRSYPETVIPPDEYFVLGDHRSVSNDSREFGPVERKYIYGKAVFVYWPTDKAGLLR